MAEQRPDSVVKENAEDGEEGADPLQGRAPQRRLLDDGVRRADSRGVFQKSPAEAYQIMMHVHVNGRGIAGVYPWKLPRRKWIP
jgi:hypothetical protein